ncbi:MAG TPA: tRNA lysidine(34) synthetase TilS [Bryobacterales bacterium]|nr:tRNA lysidine(34) synthetase TilS [Bryobacterales bacterium]
MLEQVANQIRRHQMFAAGEAVAVAVSGGADSVALLYVLRELAPRLGIVLSVIHLNHKLRGAESDADQEFVGALAGRLKLPFRTESVEIRELALSSGDNLEQTARHVRYQWFTQLISAGDAAKVAVGHTLSDQAETVLLRLLRGSGSAGLSAIRPVRDDGVVRPLLGVSREQVEDFLRSIEVEWREDSTNADLSLDRNRLRHQLMPQLRHEWNPNLPAVMARTAQWARDEEAYWSQVLSETVPRVVRRDHGEAVELSVTELTKLPVALARRILRQAVMMTRGDLRDVDWDHIERLRNLASAPRGTGAVHLPGLDALRSFDVMRLQSRPDDSGSPDFNLALQPPQVVAVPGGSTMLVLELTARFADRSGPQGGYNDRRAETLDWERVPKPLRLRNWRPGDHYRPAGRSSARKLKMLFQRSRTPVWERKGWPVLVGPASGCGSDAVPPADERISEVVVWARAFGVAAEFEPGAATRCFLRISEIDCKDSEFNRTDWV